MCRKIRKAQQSLELVVGDCCRKLESILNCDFRDSVAERIM